MSTEDISELARVLEDDQLDRIKENKEKIKLNSQLPHLVGNIVEVLDINPEDDGACNLTFDIHKSAPVTLVM